MGKISFSPSKVLGHGSAGTFVFRYIGHIMIPSDFKIYLQSSCDAYKGKLMQSEMLVPLLMNSGATLTAAT